MAEEAGKLLDLLSIDNVAEWYQTIRNMQPVDILRRLERENVSTSGHMPELRARLLRLQVKQCHPHVHVPWYSEDGVVAQEDKYQVEIIDIEEQSQIKGILDRLDLIQKQLEAFKLRSDVERADDSLKQVEQSFETVESVKNLGDIEEDNTSTSSESDSSESEEDDIYEPLEIPEEVNAIETKLSKPTDKSECKTSDVTIDEKKAEHSGKYDCKEYEKIYEKPTSCGSVTTQKPTINKSTYEYYTPPQRYMEKKTPMSPPVWPPMNLGLDKIPYQPNYQPYPSTEPLMTFRDPRVPPSNYFTNYPTVPNPVFIPANVKPYWL